MASPDHWTEVRVFISSTFRDFHRERDHLLRMVLPELQELCRERWVRVILIDLRWRVSQQEAEEGKVIDICLQEIDTCRPYFVALLGQRYGHIPPGHETSFTAQEVHHATLHENLPEQVANLNVLLDEKWTGVTATPAETEAVSRAYGWNVRRQMWTRSENLSPGDDTCLRNLFTRLRSYRRDRSLFFFRSEALTSQLAGEQPDGFFDSSPALQAKRVALHTAIRNSSMLWLDYNDIESFGKMVLESLWNCIRKDTESVEAAPTTDDLLKWLNGEGKQHALFAADRVRGFVGRENLLKRMHELAASAPGPNVLLITDEPGSGKSALMARFAREFARVHPNWLQIPHFVGSSTDSANVAQSLRRWCLLLGWKKGDDDKENMPSEVRELAPLFSGMLDRVAATKPIVLILDAADQLEAMGGAQDLRWFPQDLPARVTLVVSALPGAAADAVRERYERLVELPLGPLGVEEQRILVGGYLKEIGRAFPTPKIESVFFAKIAAGNPLYIRVALDELALYGEFESVDKKVGELPASVPELFDQVLKRIEHDFSYDLVRKCMLYLAAGRHGMTADEMKVLLRAHAPGTEASPALPDMRWARLRRSFTTYLVEYSGVLGFFHQQLRVAVINRYVNNATVWTAAHRGLADYFESRWAEPYRRALDELPYQRSEAGDATGLERVLCNLGFIEAKFRARLGRSLCEDYRRANADPLQVQQDAAPDARLPAYAKFVLAQSHVLEWRPDETLQAAANQPGDSLVARAALAQLATTPRPWLRWRNKPAQYVAPLAVWDRLGLTLTCCYLPDGKTIVTGGDKITVLDGTTGLPRREWKISGRGVAISGRNLVISRWRELTVLDLRTGRECRSMTVLSERVTWCACRDGADWFAATEADGSAAIWDFETGVCRLRWKPHSDWAYSCAVSPDGLSIATTSKDATIALSDVATGGERSRMHGHTGHVHHCSFSPDGTQLASASLDKTVKIWATDSGQLQRTLTGHPGGVGPCSFSPDGRQIASGDDRGVLRVWDVQTGQLVMQYIVRGDTVMSCNWSPDGRLVIAGSRHGLTIWRVPSQGLVNPPVSPHSRAITQAAYSADGRSIVTSGEDSMVCVWDGTSMQPRHVLTAEADSVAGCAFSPDGRQVLCAGSHKQEYIDGQRVISTLPQDVLRARRPENRRLVIHDLRLDRSVAQLDGHRAPVSACAWSSDGTLIASGAENGAIIIWDARSRKPVGGGVVTAPVTQCEFSHDGQTLICFSGMEVGKMTAWNIAANRQVATAACQPKARFGLLADGSAAVVAVNHRPAALLPLSGGKPTLVPGLVDHGSRREAPHGIVFSPDREHLAAWYYRELWVQRIGGARVTEMLFGARITQCCFGPSGRTLVVADEGGEVNFLALEAVPFRPPVVRWWHPPVRPWWSRWAAKRDQALVQCPFCQGWTELPRDVAPGITASCSACRELLVLGVSALDAAAGAWPWRREIGAASPTSQRNTRA